MLRRVSLSRGHRLRFLLNYMYYIECQILSNGLPVHDCLARNYVLAVRHLPVRSDHSPPRAAPFPGTVCSSCSRERSASRAAPSSYPGKP